MVVSKVDGKAVKLEHEKVGHLVDYSVDGKVVKLVDERVDVSVVV